MQMYHVVLMKHGPHWENQQTPDGRDIRTQVINDIKLAAEDGLVVDAGLVDDETDVEFILILNVETKYEALELLSAVPSVRDGVFEPEVHSWYADKLD